MSTSSKPWEHRNAVEFYSKYRQHVEDLYPSEREFLPPALKPGITVLDVGCAAGGFYNIMRTLEPGIQYTGMDISQASIEHARETYPDATFQVGTGTDLPFPDNSFDLVHSTGVCVHERQCLKLISELYRVSKNLVIVDVRLHKGAKPMDIQDSHLRIEFEGEFDGAVTPYVVVDPEDTVRTIVSVRPTPKRVDATGYFHDVSPLARTAYKEVFMAIFRIEKGSAGTTEPDLHLEKLPFEISVS